MVQLVKIMNHQPVTSSVHVAYVFDKRNPDVMRRIRRIIAQNNSTKKMFAKGSYVNAQNRSMPLFYMNKNGFMITVMGFTGKKALNWKLDFIHAFDIMAHKINHPYNIPKSLPQALIMAAHAITQNNKLRERQKKLAPMTRLGEVISKASTNINISRFSKILKSGGINMGPNQLFAWLRHNHYLMSNPYEWNVPYECYINRGIFVAYERKYTDSFYNHHLYIQTLVTPKGQKYLVNKLYRGAHND